MKYSTRFMLVLGYSWQFGLSSDEVYPMATRKERFLVWFDKNLSELLGAGFSRSHPGHCGAAYEYSFLSGYGRRFAIVDKEGNIRAMGRSWWVNHWYDERGNLLSRTRQIRDLEPGDRLIFGEPAVTQAYREQPCNRDSKSLGLTLE